MINRSPLLVWVVFFFLALTGLISVVVYARTTSQPQEAVDAQFHRIRSANIDAERLSVLILGNSQAVSAFPAEEEEIRSRLDEQFQKSGCTSTRVQILKLSCAGCGLPFMRKYFDRMIALKPKVMVIQADLVAPWQAPQGTVTKILADLQNVSNMMHTLILTKLGQITFQGQIQNFTKTDEVSKRNRVTTKKPKKRFRTVEKIEDKVDHVELGPVKGKVFLRYGGELIQKALANHIRVIIFEPAYSLSVTSRVSQKPFQARRATVQAQFDPYPAKYMEYPRVLPDIYFQDSRHLNPAGMEVYFSWFIRSFVQQYLKENPCRS